MIKLLLLHNELISRDQKIREYTKKQKQINKKILYKSAVLVATNPPGQNKRKPKSSLVILAV
jgi:hypothetical protein